MKFLEIFDTNNKARIFLNIYLILNLLFIGSMALLTAFLSLVAILFVGLKNFFSFNSLFLNISPFVIFISTFVYFFTKNKKLLITIVFLSFPFYIIFLQGYITRNF